MVLDKHLFESLYYDFCPRLINYARRIVCDAKLAEDFVQEAYYRLWIKYSGDDKKLSQWTSMLFSIVRNQCMDHLRKTDGVLHLPDDVNEMEALYQMDFNGQNRGMMKTVADELSEEIVRIEESLSETTRTIFHMSRIGGMKNMEIAQSLNISVKTVEKHITIALKAFRKQFEASGFLQK